MNTSKTSLKTTVEWNQVNWRKLERHVFKLQTRIYRASQRGDVKTVRKLQKTLMRSWSAKCLAVRRVTQNTLGQKTAGVDRVKSLSLSACLALVTNLKLRPRAKPTKRIRIPKRSSLGKRPLGNPTMYDQALQALVLLVLEPEWEARFAPNSDEFRPRRSCHEAMVATRSPKGFSKSTGEAIAAIYSAIRLKSQYVFVVDISLCFDCINHKALIEKLNTFPTIKQQLKAWLKAGMRHRNISLETSQDTSQDGLILPQLVNIALHGLETNLRQAFHNSNMRQGKPTIIRDVNELVVIHEEFNVIQRCQQIAAEWLNGMGLELNPSKTCITHTFYEHEGNVGFDFRGFNIRQYPIGNAQSMRNSNNKLLGFKTIIKPSKANIKEHTEKIKQTIKANKSTTQANLIKRLNSIIKGWVNNYSAVVSKETYSKLDRIVAQQLRSWALHRHPNKSKTWVSKQYWQTIGNLSWFFATQDGEMRLLRHGKTPIIGQIKILDRCNLYNSDWVY